MRQRQTHPTLRYRPHARCPACGSRWQRVWPTGKACCGVCGKRLIGKRESRKARHGAGPGVRVGFSHGTYPPLGSARSAQSMLRGVQ